MLELVRSKTFANGIVYAFRTADGYLIETTDTFLPMYTKNSVDRGNNLLADDGLGDRTERWMIGVSVMSGCPVHCRFCATGNMKRWRNLTSQEILEQVLFVIDQHKGQYDFNKASEHKINYTRMGEPFLNIENVREAIAMIEERFPKTHHYVSTIGVQGSDFSWIKDNITLQLSLHSLDEEKRNWLIPFKRKLTISELGRVRTESDLKTTVNMTLVDKSDFNLEKLKTHFDPAAFFIKLSPINTNAVSETNNMGTGVIAYTNRR